MLKKKILFNITSQFGYHTDTFMYCKYLDKNRFDISYVSFDEGASQYYINDIKIYRIYPHENKILRYFKYAWHIRKLVNKEKFDLVFQVDHKFTLWVGAFCLFKKFVLDIRTGDLTENSSMRFLRNMYIRFTTLFYKNISVISLSLSKKLWLNGRTTKIIPLGGELRENYTRNWKSIHLFYIGSLDNRNIDETVEGLAIFRSNNPQASVFYDIVGSGAIKAVRKIEEIISENDLSGFVKLHGHKRQDEIEEIWQNANIGIVYIPQKPYYDCQPSTKLFEYALAGMALIATNTYENRLLVKENTGILIEDNPVAFAQGLETILKNHQMFDSAKIREAYQNHTWEKIVKNDLEPYIASLIC